MSILTIELLPGLGSFTLEFAACLALRYGIPALFNLGAKGLGEQFQRDLDAGRPISPAPYDG